MRPFLRVATVLSALLLSACGGGGGGSGSSGGGSSTPAPAATPPVLSGVVSVGAPVGGATLSVVDAKGVALGSTTANPVDGSYRLSLSNASPALPLLVQASGVDAGGLPVLLHALVPAAANDATTTAHLTPLSQAQGALALGGDPQAAFAKAADAKLTDAAALLPAASTFLKTLVKTAFSDVKITGSDSFDLLADSRFTTAKSSADLMLESLRLQVDAPSGKLLLGTKFLANPTPEVEVNLATAKAELAKGTTGVPASAITSTLKATSAAATVLTNAATLDSIVTTLNPLLAQTSTTPALYKASTVLTGYDKHNGRTADDLATALQAWSALGLQFGPLQVLGCADTTVKKGDCARVLVASTLTDRSGKPVERLLDAATFNTTTKRWSLIGNGRSLAFDVMPSSVRFLLRGGDAPSSGSTQVFGAEVRLQATDEAFTAYQIISGTVQTPLGFALPLAACQQFHLCVAAAGAVQVTATGAPLDHMLQPGEVGWLGNADGLRGAAYKATFTRATAAAETVTSYLPSQVLFDVAAARHPTLDGVTTSAPLTIAALAQGLNLKWTAWAKANPDLKMTQVRVAVRYADRAGMRTVGVLGLTETTVLPIGAAAGLTLLGHDVWLSAVDGAGRRYHTRYALGVSDTP